MRLKDLHTPPPPVIRNRGDKKSSTQKPRKNCIKHIKIYEKL